MTVTWKRAPPAVYLTYLDNDHYYVYDVTTKTTVNITKNVKTSFINMESDYPITQKAPFGVAG